MASSLTPLAAIVVILSSSLVTLFSTSSSSPTVKAYQPISCPAGMVRTFVCPVAQDRSSCNWTCQTQKSRRRPPFVPTPTFSPLPIRSITQSPLPTTKACPVETVCPTMCITAFDLSTGCNTCDCNEPQY